MSQKVIVSREGYNVLTDTNIDHLQFSSDYNTLKYSLANGSKTLIVSNNTLGYYNVSGEETHGLGYKPFFKVYASLIGLIGYSPLGFFKVIDQHNIFLSAKIDENKIYFNASGRNTGTAVISPGNLQSEYSEFHSDKNNTLVEVFDYSNRNQCVDLVTAWFMKLGYSQFILAGVLNAYEIFTNTPAIVLADFDRIAYTVTNSPPRVGDIVVWDSGYGGGAGHTGIATGVGDSSFFDCFQQNDNPFGGNPNTISPSRDKTYHYNNVLGWLRLKNQGSGDITMIPNSFNYTVVFKYKIFKNNLNL